MPVIRPIDSFERTDSEADYGTYHEFADLYEDNGRFYLRTQNGYSKPWATYWYELGGRPQQTLASFKGRFNVQDEDQSAEFAQLFGCSVTTCDQLRDAV